MRIAGNPNRPAALRESGGDDEAVTPVIPGPAENRHGSRREATQDLARHGVPGILHQQRLGCSLGNRRSIGVRHLRYGEQRARQRARIGCQPIAPAPPRLPEIAPISEVTAIASALQNATRSAPLRMSAPPTLADQPPSSNKQTSETATTESMR